MNTTTFKMVANYHTHTNRCKHAVGCEEDYVKEAIREKLDAIAISDHAPFPDNRFNFSRMRYEELDDYLNEIERLNNLYDIEIFKSLEIEFFDDQIDYYRYLLEDKNLDFLLLGQHYFKSDGHFLSTFDFTKSKDALVYAKVIKQALDTKYFKILAHPDVFMINDFKCDKYIDQAIDIIIEAALRNDVYLEFNANGIRKGYGKYSDGIRYPYPYKKFWEKVAKTKVGILINSDCHDPMFLNDDSVNKAFKLASELNLNITAKI